MMPSPLPFTSHCGSLRCLALAGVAIGLGGMIHGGAPVGAQPVAPEVLADAIASGVAFHPNVRADRLTVEAATEGVRTAYAGFAPALKVDGEVNRNEFQRALGSLALSGRAAAGEVEWTLFNGGRNFQAVDIARFEREAVVQDYRNNLNTLLGNLSRAFVNVVRERRMVVVAQHNLNEHRRAIARVSAIVARDPGKEFDLVQIRSREAQAASILAERQGLLQVALSQFKEIVGRLPAPELTSPGLFPEERFSGLEAFVRESLEHHPMVLSARARTYRRTAERLDALGSLAPKVEAVGRVVRGADRQGLVGQNDENYLGLRSHWTFGLAGREVFNLRNAANTEEAAREKHAAAQREVREKVRVAWAMREQVKAVLPAAEGHFTISGKVLEGFKTQYTLGRRNMLDLLIMQNENYQAEARYLQLKYDRLLSDFNLLEQGGLLLGELQPQVFLEQASADVGATAPIVLPPHR